LLAGLLLSVGGGRAFALGHHHHGAPVILIPQQGFIQTGQSAPLAMYPFAPVAAPAVQMAPVAQYQFAPVATQFHAAPVFGQAQQFAPAAVSFQLAPAAAASLQLAPATQAYQLAPAAAQSVQFAPVAAPTMPLQYSVQGQALQASPEDQDAYYLAQGFGGRISLIRSLEEAVSRKIRKLADRGLLNREELASLALTVAKDFLATQGFGIPIALVEPILKRVVERVISRVATSGERTERPSDRTGGRTEDGDETETEDTTGERPFEIRGRIYLRPVGGSSRDEPARRTKPEAKPAPTPQTNPRTNRDDQEFTIPGPDEQADAD
jgi:hypothetical protein